ncbi:hypothetical protein OG311_09125 [Streptomyces sp. NBC_01343]|uniref:hypothetical protein n=1 Tax=Streptomyces sp. NBC_01343 TaxID=2903832 RepID=UPI002E10D3A5|nr:hypothetical protein OG311_09125 [Streptomyces sp. NBC_01343]
MRGNTRRALVALVLAAGIGTGSLSAAAAAAAASEVPGTGHRVGAGVEIPGIDPGKDCIVTTAWGNATCPARQY